MAPTISCPIPSGPLRIAFAGEDAPVISGIAPDSPVSEHMRVGFKFCQLILGDGAIIEGLDTYELVAALNDSINDPDRYLKMEMCFPESSTVVLGPGNPGLVVEDRGGKAIVTRCMPESPVKKQLRVGMQIDKIQLADGFTATGHSAEELNALINTSEQDEKRILTMISPDSPASPRSTVLPKFSSLYLPPGTTEELGLILSGEIATIGAISTEATIEARPGMMVSVLTLPDGNQLFQLSGDDLTSALDKTCEVDGRIIICKNPALIKLPAQARTKLMLPTEGGIEDLGFEVAGSPAVVTKVSDSSLFAGLIVEGFAVKKIGWVNGTEFEDIDANDIEDILTESSGIEGRYMICLNTVSVKPSPKMEVQHSGPQYIVVDLPEGKLGLSFQGQPPACTKVSPTSPVQDQVEVGYVAHSLILSDGKVYENMDTLQLTDALKASKDETDRKLTFINPGSDDLLPGSNSLPQEQPAYEPAHEPAHAGHLDADYKTVLLPIGKLGITFKGKDTPALISKVKEGSPLLEEDVEGMGVDTITVKNREHMEMNAVEVATLIKATSDVEGRILKVRDPQTGSFQKLPEKIEVVCPKGTLGVTFQSTPPTAKAFKDDSPVGHQILPGMYVDEVIMPDGYSQRGFSAKELVVLLGGLSQHEGRTLVLKNQKTTTPSPKGETFPAEKTIDLPDGKLGISFKGKKHAKISRVHAESPLLGMVYVGMAVDSLTIPGGSTFRGMTAKEVASTLVDTKNVSGRTMVLKAPIVEDGDTTLDSNFSGLVSARG
eukprot:CAMPEP_0194202368 /NCGR_PEP_ID=MMETSP0156-20130528/2406_1 /TAXON_ID=33649 /ORGANISM="Thalassionema nitzschioides, Strain L26-B" /LENGTH=774 /DNA_ID=CAMNT_0038927841 /DNA_START=48 /DNA_END=2372 /DNA_ORIENTATION=-